MCCFAKPVISVQDTNIFARLTDQGTQLLAYQMDFRSEKPNAMILPLPVPVRAKDDAVKFLSLKGYDNLFKDLSKGFPSLTPKSRGGAGGFGDRSKKVDSKLVVHEVGDFIASFVPSIKDFSRLDQQFVIPKESWDKIPRYATYGFAVFQLKKLKGTTHPMAFEFKTRLRDQIFFPTVHIHDGEVHKREKFDHALYLQDERWDKKVGKYVNRHVKDRATGFVRSKESAKGFCDIEKAKGLIVGDQLVHRLEMVGRYANEDVFANLRRGSVKLRKGSIGQYWPFAPAVAGVAALGWLFNRRDEVANEDEE